MKISYNITGNQLSLESSGLWYLQSPSQVSALQIPSICINIPYTEYLSLMHISSNVSMLEIPKKYVYSYLCTFIGMFIIIYK